MLEEVGRSSCSLSGICKKKQALGSMTGLSEILWGISYGLKTLNRQPLNPKPVNPKGNN